MSRSGRTTSRTLFARTVVVWLVLLVVAVANGVVRQAFLTPHVGDTAGRAISTILLSVLILVLAWLTIRWIGPRGTVDAVIIGACWVVLTLAFEFLAGHYVFGNSWEMLLEDYDLAAGRIWILVPIVTLISPVIAYGSGRAERI